MSATTLEATPPPARGPLLRGLPWITWLRFALWLLVGLAIYFLYGMKRSGLRAQA